MRGEASEASEGGEIFFRISQLSSSVVPLLLESVEGREAEHLQ